MYYIIASLPQLELWVGEVFEFFRAEFEKHLYSVHCIEKNSSLHQLQLATVGTGLSMKVVREASPWWMTRTEHTYRTETLPVSEFCIGTEQSTYNCSESLQDNQTDSVFGRKFASCIWKLLSSFQIVVFCSCEKPESTDNTARKVFKNKKIKLTFFFLFLFQSQWFQIGYNHNTV